MTISPVYSGRPKEIRDFLEQRVYDLLDELNIPYERVDHDAAYDMGACGVISQVLGVRICKNLLLTPRNRSAFYLLAMPDDLPFRTADFSKIIGSSRLSFATEEDLREYCRHRIAFYKTPAHFFIVKNFPETASGKIQKFKLREQAREMLKKEG